jgi:3-oxoacyl-[acyl-carrier protein] reductase
MSDRFQSFANNPLGKRVVNTLGLPTPVPLRRWEPGQSVVSGPVHVGGAHGGRLGEALDGLWGSIGATAVRDPAEDQRFSALVFDATGIDSSERLRALYDFFHPVVRRVQANGRVVVLGTPPEACASSREHTAQRALEGFTRSLAKEIGKGATVNLVYVAPGAEAGMESTLRFFLSSRSAFVSAQVVRITPVEEDAILAPPSWDHPLQGRVACVTGASRGIGKSIAETLARDGAEVVLVDVPQAGEALTEVANTIGGTAVQLDITGANAPQTLADHVRDRHGGLDVMVHNAGVTRDKTLGRMDDQQWDLLLDINLSAPERIDDALLEGDLLKPGGRIIGVSSMSGIAGNRGQTNYATSKAGMIGHIQALAATLLERQGTINAVAPGFIETQMTAAMPLATREAGRRMSSLAQGGQPVDVAETIGWFAQGPSAGVNGNVVRVDGQNLLGA